jgi:acyl-coenzyme A thioesterase PaaI-like protein
MQLMTTLKPDVEKSSSLIERSGLKVLDLRRGYVKCLMPLEVNSCHEGTLPTGALFMLVEASGKAIFLSSFNTSRFQVFLKHTELKMERAANSEVTLVVQLKETVISQVTAKADITGRGDYVLEGVLRDEEDEIVARFQAGYQVTPVKQ